MRRAPPGGHGKQRRPENIEKYEEKSMYKESNVQAVFYKKLVVKPSVGIIA